MGGILSVVLSERATVQTTPLSIVRLETIFSIFGSVYLLWAQIFEKSGWRFPCWESYQRVFRALILVLLLTHDFIDFLNFITHIEIVRCETPWQFGRLFNSCFPQTLFFSGMRPFQRPQKVTFTLFHFLSLLNLYFELLGTRLTLARTETSGASGTRLLGRRFFWSWYFPAPSFQILELNKPRNLEFSISESRIRSVEFWFLSDDLTVTEPCGTSWRVIPLPRDRTRERVLIQGEFLVFHHAVMMTGAL